MLWLTFSPLTWRRRVPRHTIVPLHTKWNLMWSQLCLIFRTFRFIIRKLSFLWDTKKAITSSSNFGSVFFFILIVVFVCAVCIKVCGLPFSSTHPDGGLFALTLLAGGSAEDRSVKFVCAGVSSKRTKWEKERRGKMMVILAAATCFHCVSKKISVNFERMKEGILCFPEGRSRKNTGGGEGGGVSFTCCAGLHLLIIKHFWQSAHW